MRMPDLWEQHVIDELVSRGFEIYLPFRDKGVDLVAIKDWQNPVRIQVKGSRVHRSFRASMLLSRILAQAQQGQTIKNDVGVDTYMLAWQEFGQHGRTVVQYLVVPTKTLIGRLSSYQAGRWDLYISLGNSEANQAQVADVRPSPAERLPEAISPSDPRDYSTFLNNWAIVEAQAQGRAPDMATTIHS